MTTESGPHRDTSRYEALGLVANPFAAEFDDGIGVGVALEIEAASSRLLGVLTAASQEETPKPILVSKTTEVPSYYHLRAVSGVESALINDESLNLLHAYIQLYMMRKGRVRSTLGVVGERLAFRSFEQTLVPYIEKILEATDDELASYALLGPEGLAAFAERFGEDPVGVVNRYFGEPDLERRPELGEVVDLRLSGLEADIVESEASAELDGTVGQAPGTGFLLPEKEEDDDVQAVVDYIIEYTATHLSKVVARGLRIYRERGLAALSTELKVTKAPRKTLGAVVRLATTRFNKVAIIYDGFDNWAAIAPDMKQTIVDSLSEMRDLLEGDALFVLLLETGRVPELEEQFGFDTKVEWDFPWLEKAQNEPDELDMEMVHSWLRSATLPGHSADFSALDALTTDADGDLGTFVAMARAAIEDAAERGVPALDDEALDAGRAAVVQEDE